VNKVSIIIPARNEIYLEKTIKNILENATGDIEIIVVLDGWVPNPPIFVDGTKVKFIHNKESIGQRQAINQAAKQATGNYFMKIDAHCAVDKGFDTKLIVDCEYDWTVIPRMYNLDVKTWQPKFINDTATAIRRRKLHDYMYIGWNEKNELRTLYYPSKENAEWHSRTELIDDTMSCMGCCFFMHMDRFWELGGCDEGHGGWGSQGIEVAMKAQLSGGALKVNKKTWFAHWFRASDGGFPYEISGRAIDRSRKYAADLWLNNKWEKQTRDVKWLIDKFNPPSWNRYFNRVVLNLGSGTTAKVPGITNIDLVPNPGVDKVHDIADLPYDDYSVDKIMATEVLEHFGKIEALSVLKEWYRVLIDGGALEVQVPDGERILERWQNLKWDRLVDSLVGRQLSPYDYHKMIFSKKTFEAYLKDAGFQINKIKRFSIRDIPRMKAICTKTV
jgi:predicted SAM-dependent methyltransferase